MNEDDEITEEKPSYNFALAAIAFIMAVLYAIIYYISVNVFDTAYYQIMYPFIFSGVLIVALLIFFVSFTTISYETNDNALINQTNKCTIGIRSSFILLTSQLDRIYIM